jgi:hypothetical protein
MKTLSVFRFKRIQYTSKRKTERVLSGDNPERPQIAIGIASEESGGIPH